MVLSRPAWRRIARHAVCVSARLCTDQLSNRVARYARVVGSLRRSAAAVDHGDRVLASRGVADLPFLLQNHPSNGESRAALAPLSARQSSAANVSDGVLPGNPFLRLGADRSRMDDRTGAPG